MDIVKFLWMTPVQIFEWINPITWMSINKLLAHFLTFCLYYVLIRVILLKLKDKTNNNKYSINNSMERDRQASIQQAKEQIYQNCFSKLTESIPLVYKRNGNVCSILITAESFIRLDRDTIHQVLTKASYDAIKSIGLKTSNKPLIVVNSSLYYSVQISW